MQPSSFRAPCWRSLRHIAALSAALACGAQAQEAMRVGFSDSPPISFRDAATKELRGLAVSVFAEIAREAGFEAKPEMMSFGDLLSSLTTIKTDVVTMSGTPERRKVAAFSKPFAKYGEALLARVEDATAYTGLDQLRGKRVGSNAGGGWIDAAKQAGAEVVTFAGAEQSLQALEKGDVAAVVGNAPTYAHLLRGGAYPHVRIVPTYQPKQTNELAFGVRLAETARLERIDRAIAALSARGALDKLRTEWGFSN